MSTIRHLQHPPDHAAAPKRLLRMPGTAVLGRLGSLALIVASTLARAEESTTAPVSELNRIVVTGSNIRRTDAETPSPVQVLNAADIARSGYSSVADVLHNVTANNMGSLGQGSPGAFGAGGSGISLRGLTVGATLVLIDGHRMASYPLPDDGERDFVDISSLPIDAIDRIEVLKDGASAIYGSDAIAGVVNVILKKKQEGTTLHAEAGTSSRHDGTTLHVSGITGIGNLDSEGYNAYLSLDFRSQDPIALSARPQLANADWTPYGGNNLTPANPNPALQVSPRTQNLSLLGKFSKVLSDDWSANVSASLLGSDATQVGLYNNLVANPATNLSASGITNFVFGPNHPIPTPATITTVFTPNGSAVNNFFGDVGAQTTKTQSTSYRVVAELNGTWNAWDIQAAAGLTRVETVLSLYNFLDLPALQGALNNGSYVLGGPNSASAINAIAPAAASKSHNDLHFLSLRGSRELFKLPGGALSVGAGVEFDHRSLDEEFPSSFANGSQSSNIYAFGIGQQNIAAAYAELVAPVLKNLEIDAAARIDHYDTYGSSVTPKLGVKYSPSQQVTLRGTFAEGFRAPNPVESGLSGSSAGFLPPLVDTALCKLNNVNPCNIPVGGTELQLPGHNLQPEKSKSYTLGTILEPTDWINLSLDYYDIRITNQIVSVGLFGQSQIDNPALYGTQLYRVNSPTTPNAAPTSANDSILYGTYPFINLGETRTNGVDVDLRLKLDGGDAGRFTPQLQWTHMIHYTINRGGQVYELAGTHGPSFVSTNTGTPRDRAALGLTWQKGPLELTGMVNYVSDFSVVDPSYGAPTCAAALASIFAGTGNTPPGSLCSVGSFTELNVSGRYTLSKSLSIRASVNNLLNRSAPIDASASGSTGGGVANGGARYDPSLHQDGAVGRFFNVGMTYSF